MPRTRPCSRPTPPRRRTRRCSGCIIRKPQSGNRLHRENALDHDFDELYHADGAANGYDDLNRLVEFQRGALSDANSDGVPDTITSESRTQEWALDALGNWDSIETNGGGPVSRSHNEQNQITAGIGGSPAYDDNGNFLGTSGNQSFDAWNRFALWEGLLGITVANEYDALQRRIQRTYDDPGLGSPLMGSTATTTDHYYTSSWQIIEDRIGNDVTQQFVYSQRYVNAPVLRDRDTDTDGIVDERHYYQQDANFNVTALIDISGDVVERVVNDAYGTPTFLDPNWSSPSNLSSFGNDVVFQGGRRDPTTGFINFQHRDYSTTLGRPIQVDWIHYADSMSLYQWELSNPLKWVDSTGLGSVMPTPNPSEPPPGWSPLLPWPPPPPSEPPPTPLPILPPTDGPTIGPLTSDPNPSCIEIMLSLLNVLGPGGIGPKPGSGDSWLHCYYSCVLSLACGENFAIIMGGSRETLQALFDDVPDLSNDVRANAVGIKVARGCYKKPPEDYCFDACSEKY